MGLWFPIKADQILSNNAALFLSTTHEPGLVQSQGLLVCVGYYYFMILFFYYK